MKIELRDPPRAYKPGKGSQITIKDMGSIALDPDEQITFITPDKKEYDVCRKSWGYYATPSVNDRLKRFGFKTALVKNLQGQIYVMIVESAKISEFEGYLSEENNALVQWLDEESLAYG